MSVAALPREKRKYYLKYARAEFSRIGLNLVSNQIRSIATVSCEQGGVDNKPRVAICDHGRVVSLVVGQVARVSRLHAFLLGWRRRDC
jgi:hypothetical protein